MWTEQVYCRLRECQLYQPLAQAMSYSSFETVRAQNKRMDNESYDPLELRSILEKRPPILRAKFFTSFFISPIVFPTFSFDALFSDGSASLNVTTLT